MAETSQPENFNLSKTKIQETAGERFGPFDANASIVDLTRFRNT